MRGSSSDAIRKKLFLSSFKFVTHLSCRSCLILRRATLMDSWADDAGNSRRGFAGPNQDCLILPCSVRLFMYVWMNGRTRLVVTYLQSPAPAFLHLVFLKNKRVVPVFLRIFFPSFLVREDPILLSSGDAYCCTYREDVGNRLPLCEG